jgi:hypothetical protein
MWFMRGKKGESKYRNKKVEIDGTTFHSKAEANRYLELKLLEKGGKIKDLVLQPRFPMHVNGHKICTYVADFKYTDTDTNVLVVEDVKGFETDIFKLKAKLFAATHPHLTLTLVSKRRDTWPPA